MYVRAGVRVFCCCFFGEGKIFRKWNGEQNGRIDKAILARQALGLFGARCHVLGFVAGAGPVGELYRVCVAQSVQHAK